MSFLEKVSEIHTVDLDQVDRDILAILQNNGRRSASDISKKIGMSIPAVTDRIKKLQEEGVIIGFTSMINHKKIGLDVCAFITIISESSSHYSEVVRQAKTTTEVVQCFTTTGNGSHVLLAVTKNTSSLEKLLRTIQSWPGVMRTETQMVLSSYKNVNTLQIP